MTAQLSTPAPSSPVLIRRIRRADVERIGRFYAALSEDSRRFRFLSAGTSVDTVDATYFCGLDHRHREGFIAVTEDSGRQTIVGHLCLEPAGARSAEIAVAVADAFQGQGIGRDLTLRATRWARRHRIDRLSATCATDNAGILRLFRGLGRPITFGASAASGRLTGRPHAQPRRGPPKHNCTQRSYGVACGGPARTKSDHRDHG